jgi:hypothetical protein
MDKLLFNSLLDQNKPQASHLPCADNMQSTNVWKNAWTLMEDTVQSSFWQFFRVYLCMHTRLFNKKAERLCHVMYIIYIRKTLFRKLCIQLLIGYTLNG